MGEEAILFRPFVTIPRLKQLTNSYYFFSMEIMSHWWYDLFYRIVHGGILAGASATFQERNMLRIRVANRSEIEWINKELLEKYQWCKEKYAQSTFLLVLEQ